MNETFFCKFCWRHRPLAGKRKHPHSANPICLDCSTGLRRPTSASAVKTHAKNYRAGKLPGWMKS